VRIWRDRLLADEHFRRWAAGFPLTRAIAQRHARSVFDLCAGFVYSQILVAAVELDLFEILAQCPQSARTVAPKLGLGPDAAHRLLAGAAALGLLQRRGTDIAGDDRFGLGPLGAALRGNPGLVAMIRHHRMLYADLADPVALLRGGVATELARYWSYSDRGQPRQLATESVAAYSALMAASQALVADDILDAYSIARHSCLLDLGGGNGSFLTRAAVRAPALRLGLFDLPAVASLAESRLKEAGLDERVTVTGGDFLHDSLPAGADLITLIRVVHDHDDDFALVLLRNARAALAPGGILLLGEPMADAPGAAPMGDAYFGFYLLAMGQGRPRRAEELEVLLRAAGFQGIRRRPTRRPMLVGVVTAEK
jgi:demethylspheroidene O-methyltransferase